jgi:hypothetical protein
MPESLYNAINGQEAKTMMINRLSNAINSLPYMKRGNTFHRLYCWLKIDIRAYPADVPTPKGEFEFELKPDDLNKMDNEDIRKEYDIHVTKFDKTLGLIKVIDERIEELYNIKQNYLDFVNQHYPSLLNEVIEIGNNESKPDYLRIKEGLPLHVLEQDRNTNRTYEKEQTYQPVAGQLDTFNLDIKR